MMTANVGRKDRWVRVAVGIALLAAGWMTGGPWGITLGVIAFVPILTGAFGWCPLYAIFNLNTCPLHRGHT